MLTETTRSPLLTNATTASFMFPTLTAGQIERIAAHGVLRPAGWNQCRKKEAKPILPLVAGD